MSRPRSTSVGTPNRREARLLILSLEILCVSVPLWCAISCRRRLAEF